MLLTETVRLNKEKENIALKELVAKLRRDLDERTHGVIAFSPVTISIDIVTFRQHRPVELAVQETQVMAAQ